MNDFKVLPNGFGEINTEKERPLTKEQEAFCYYYMFDEKTGGNATKAYKMAYNKTGKMTDKVASVCASQLLALPKIQKKNREFLVAKGLNSEWLDHRLMDLAKTSNKKINIEAVKELNRVQGRIVSKQITTNIDANQLLDQLQGRDTPDEAEY